MTSDELAADGGRRSVAAATPDAAAPTERRPPWWSLGVAVILLATFAALCIGSMARMSITGDEVTHLPAGYTYVATGDFRLNPQHPPLIKALAGLPLLAFDLHPVEETLGWPRAREWVFGKQFLTHNRARLDRLVFWGRVPMVLVGVLLGVLLYAWARRLWGDGPGLFVLLLYVFCPNLLAHAPIVHTDVGVSCFSLLAIAALWRFARSGRLLDAAWCGVGLGLALLSKYSALVTAVVVALLFAVITLSREGEGKGEGDENFPDPFDRPHPDPLPRGRGRTLLSAALLIALIPALMITIGFGFPTGLANYWRGVTLIHADANPHWEAFLWGQYAPNGFWYYYLLAQLWKMPLPTLGCFAAALFLIGRVRRATSLDWLFILLPVAAFHAAGAWQRSSIGVRHILPAFPFMMLAGGATAIWVADRGRVARLGLAALALWLVAGTLRMYPHFLPYFNELAGGPAGGAFHLDDSNVEWGQGFHALAEWLEREHPQRARMLAFEPLDHEVYGIAVDEMHLRDVVWPEPGVTYLAGASYLQRSSLYNDRPGLRFEWLERYRPVAQVGWTIDVFRFSTDPADADRTDVIYVPRERWYADAVERLTSMVNRWPDFALARDTLADVYTDRARWHELQGRADAALRDAWNAAALAQGGEYKAAFRDAATRLAPAVRPDGGPPAAAFRAAAAACASGASGECVLALLRTIGQQPEHLAAHLNLGSVYAQAGYPALAVREWERCLAIDPGFNPARENLARLRGTLATGDEQEPEHHR